MKEKRVVFEECYVIYVLRITCIENHRHRTVLSMTLKNVSIAKKSWFSKQFQTRLAIRMHDYATSKSILFIFESAKIFNGRYTNTRPSSSMVHTLSADHLNQDYHFGESMSFGAELEKDTWAVSGKKAQNIVRLHTFLLVCTRQIDRAIEWRDNCGPWIIYAPAMTQR